MITYYICGQLTDPAKTHRYYAGSPLLVQSILSVEIMNFAFAPNHCVFPQHVRLSGLLESCSITQGHLSLCSRLLHWSML